MLRILKRIVFIFIGLICLSLGWYGLQRGLAGARQIQITDLGELHIPAVERNSSYEALRVGAYNIAHGRGGKLGESNWSSAVREDEEEHLLKLAAQIVNTDTLLSKDERFHYSEVPEAFAMAELYNGKDKIPQRAFKAAWEKPSQNVARHAEWVTRHMIPSLRGFAAPTFNQSTAAEAHSEFEQGDVKSALAYCEIWRFEETYFARPIVFISHILVLIEEFEQVIELFHKARDRNLLTYFIVSNFVYALPSKGYFEEGDKVISFP